MHVDVHFADETLALLETDKAADTRLPVAVIRTVRQRLNILRAAPSLRSLQAWRSFGLSALACEGEVQTVDVKDNWKMTMQFDGGVEVRATVLGMHRHEGTRGAAND